MQRPRGQSKNEDGIVCKKGRVQLKSSYARLKERAHHPTACKHRRLLPGGERVPSPSLNQKIKFLPCFPKLSLPLSARMALGRRILPWVPDLKGLRTEGGGICPGLGPG